MKTDLQLPKAIGLILLYLVMQAWNMFKQLGCFFYWKMRKNMVYEPPNVMTYLTGILIAPYVGYHICSKRQIGSNGQVVEM